MGYAKLFSPDFITKDRSARKKMHVVKRKIQKMKFPKYSICFNYGLKIAILWKKIILLVMNSCFMLNHCR